MRTVLLVVEVAAAVVALAALVVMVVNMVQARRGERPAQGPEARAGHMRLSMVLVGAALVHGLCATAYDSGALAATYGLGWAAAACMVVAGVVMVPAVRDKIGSGAPIAHRALFAAALVLFLAHIVAGRL